jgi:putative transposase
VCVSHPHPRAYRVSYVYLDATYLNVRNAIGQVVSMAVIVASGIAADGSREILGLDVGDNEDETFWRGFLTDLKQRGLAGCGW